LKKQLKKGRWLKKQLIKGRWLKKLEKTAKMTEKGKQEAILHNVLERFRSNLRTLMLKLIDDFGCLATHQKS
jgi:hypothetical protein